MSFMERIAKKKKRQIVMGKEQMGDKKSEIWKQWSPTSWKYKIKKCFIVKTNS